MKKTPIVLLFTFAIVLELSPLKSHLVKLLIKSQLLNPYSWSSFLFITLLFSIILTPIQGVFYSFNNKMQIVNSVYIKNKFKMTEEVIEISKKIKLPTKKQVFLILLINVITYDVFISILSGFKLNTPLVAFIPIGIIFMISTYFLVYRFCKQRINHKILIFLMSITFSCVILSYVKEEIVIFIVIEIIVFYLYNMFFKIIKR
ncbi:hypothetical protein LDE09_000601 [Staphylococcus pseudintermedius]|nr:hypothetical protein [Staphylococcus pseudintermedius]